MQLNSQLVKIVVEIKIL